MVYIPDDSDFNSFRDQCESQEGWHSQYNKGGVTVWSQAQEESKTVQKIKMQIACKDVPAETLYDVLHDTHYRKKWDSNMIETYDIGRLTVNADVGYYSCENPSAPSPHLDARAGPGSRVKCKQMPVMPLTGEAAMPLPPCQLSNGDSPLSPGSLPKWVVNKVSQFVAPKAMKKIYKAGLKYQEWKRKHDPAFKPWVYPEQNTLPSVSLAELSLQHADSFENIDESSLAEDRMHISDEEA
uniref:START domain-containing protein n=1 Tax=Sphenodon punctatus TaxID=8508 RepID=A0A8D0G4S0_SPHPU